MALEGLLPYLTGERRERVLKLVDEVKHEIVKAEKKQAILAALNESPAA